MPKKGGGRVAAIEILISTMRTREYVEKGEREGKTLVDAMHDGVLEGMQHYDMIIEKMIREGTIEVDTGLAYATNAGNMRLNLSDMLDETQKEMAQADAREAASLAPKKTGGETEIEIER
jgi:twitching motility protein PilT